MRETLRRDRNGPAEWGRFRCFEGGLGSPRRIGAQPRLCSMRRSSSGEGGSLVPFQVVHRLASLSSERKAGQGAQRIGTDARLRHRRSSARVREVGCHRGEATATASGPAGWAPVACAGCPTGTSCGSGTRSRPRCPTGSRSSAATCAAPTASSPPGPPASRAPSPARRRRRRQGRDRPAQPARVPRDLLRRAAARRGPGERELPLRRRRDAVPARRLRRRRDRHRAPVRAPVVTDAVRHRRPARRSLLTLGPSLRSGRRRRPGRGPARRRPATT